MKTKIVLISVLVLAGFVIVTLAKDNVTTDRRSNPYGEIYTKSVTNMERVEYSLNDLKVNREAKNPPALAASKTCSKRCSKRCSKSCTTTRGCSVLCKSYTEGCTAPSTSRSRPSITPVLPSEKLDATPVEEKPPAIPDKRFDGVQPVKVAVVTGGDTLTVATGQGSIAVRLIGVDAQGKNPLGGSKGSYRVESQSFLTNLLKGESIYLEYEDSPKKDYLGQTLAYVYRAPDGLFVNLEIVRQGYGRLYSLHTSRYMDIFRFYEKKARSVQKGMWMTSKTATTSDRFLR